MLKDLLILAQRATEISGRSGHLIFEYPKQGVKATLFIGRNDQIVFEIKVGKSYVDGIYMQRHVDVNKLGYLRRLVSSLETTEKILQKY